MADIDKEHLAEIVGYHEDAEILKKEVRIIFDNIQFSVRIPKKFAKVAKLNAKTDKFEFRLVPLENGRFTIDAELVRGENEKAV